MAKSIQPKLNVRFNNPNSDEALADYFIKLFVKVNMKKLEEAILKEMREKEETTYGTI